MRAGFHILRVGIAITFLWIGVLIVKDPISWGGYIQPWALNLLPADITQIMYLTAFMDIVVGVLLLTGVFVPAAALVGLIHLITVLIVAGINPVTVRDIGLLSGTIAIFAESLPRSIFKK